MAALGHFVHSIRINNVAKCILEGLKLVKFLIEAIYDDNYGQNA